MKGEIIKTSQLKMISLVLLFSILLQILIPIILPLNSIASDSIEESVTTEFAGEMKLITSKNTSINAGDQITVDVWLSGGDTEKGYEGVVGFEGYIIYDENIFNEIDTTNITTRFGIDNSSGVDEEGYFISVRDGNNIGATNSIMFSITFVAKAAAEVATVSLSGVWLTVKGTPSATDYGIDDAGYDVSITFPGEAETYSIAYNDPSGEATNMPANGTKRENASYTIEPVAPATEPERPGYRFTGWSTSADANNPGTVYAPGDTYTTNSNLTLYAQWEEIKGTLVVEPNGGVWEGKSTVQTIEGREGTTKTIANPTETPNGNVIQFNANGGETATLSKTQTTTFDRWEFTGSGEFQANTYTYGAGTGTLTAQYRGDNITLPTATKAGATMEGWYTEQIGGTKVGEPGETWNPDSSRTLFAHWNEIDYTLTINLNGGKVGEDTAVAPIIGKYNETVDLPEATGPLGFTVTLNKNNGTSAPEVKQLPKRLDKWTKSDGPDLTGPTYTFGESKETITAHYTESSVELEDPEERIGYEFKGWYKDVTDETTKVETGFIPTENTELTAKWEAKKYTVTFNPGENAAVDPTTKEVTYGGTYGTLPVPTKPGGRFLGWYNGEVQITEGTTVDITGPVTLTAKWEEVIYTLTINLNGGTVENSATIAPITGKYNETVTLPIVTAPEGYTITLNNNYGENQTNTKKQTQRLEKWTTVDGTEITGTTYTFGEKNETITAQYKRELVTLEPIERTGYTFEGWYTEATNGTKVNNEYEPTGNVELFAHWTANKYEVTFNPGENATVTPTSKEVTYGETYGGAEGTLPTPNKTGGRFLGWYKGETQITASSIVDITGPVTLTARWEGEVYTLTVNLNGGTVENSATIAPITGNYGETITLPTVTAPEGYTVTLNNNYGENQTTAKKQTQRLEKWTTQDGSEITGTTYTFGEANETITAVYVREPVTLEAPAERTGYTFDGWYTEATNGTKVDNQYEPTGDTQLYAHWTANNYMVTFAPGENVTVTPTSKEVTYGETYGRLPTPNKSGSTFLGWYNGETQITADSIVEITSDITLTAKWEDIIYTLTIDLNGGTVGESTTLEPLTGKYNETVTLPTVTPPEGYTITLNTNYGENQTIIKKQTQRLEKWRVHSTDITGTTYTFGTVSDTAIAIYVREPVTLDPIERPGYRFDGWYTEATNGTKVDNQYEPTGDIQLYAHWTAEKYTVTFEPGENATVTPTSKEVTYGGKYGTLPVPTKPGGKFLGWYNGEIQITEDNIVEITNDITLTARWEGEVYTLTVNLNGGTVENSATIAPITGNYGETITLPTVTAPEGYTVTLNNNYGENQTTTKKQTQRLEKWTTQGGSEITGTTYTFGEADDTITAVYVREPVTLEAPAERTGYTFDGWYTEATSGTKVNNQYEPTGNTQLFAHWIAEKYTITFNPGNNATVDTTSKEVTYEEKYGTLPVPQKPGYEFNGWYDGEKEITADDIVDITEDTTLTAKWLGAQFTVTFDYGEGQGTETTRIVRNEATYGQLPEATREGYDFTGWFNDNGNKIESTTVVNLK